MDEHRYYAMKYIGYREAGPTELWKVNKRVHLGTTQDEPRSPGLAAYITLTDDLDDTIPDTTEFQKYWRVSRDVFNKNWNEQFQELQKARLHGGEYYIQRYDSGKWIKFHAFLRDPSRHYTVSFDQDAEYAEIMIDTELTITYRRGIALHNPPIAENTFIKAFNLTLEFLYDGSAMPANQGKLWEILDALGGSAHPDEPLLINEDYYYQRARELMLKRTEEIKLRLLELDDKPSKRRELRAEMKGINYCVSILDKNH